MGTYVIKTIKNHLRIEKLVIYDPIQDWMNVLQDQKSFPELNMFFVKIESIKDHILKPANTMNTSPFKPKASNTMQGS